MADLVGVGHCCHDHLCIVREYPPEDGSTRILEIHSQGGGAVATALVAAARLGIESALIGVLGQDRIGDEIMAEFKSENVRTNSVQRLKDAKSLVSYVMVYPENGTRTKFPLLDTNKPIKWDETQRETLKNAKVLHLDGTHYENARQAAELAKEFGVPISLDGCTKQANNELNKELASMADILITNSDYPKAVAEKDTLEEALLEMSTWGPRIVMTTMGAQGVYAVIDGKVRHYPAKKVNVVDTTGAGDVFHGAFLAGYLKGFDLEKCIDLAQFVSGKKCEQIGGRQGIPTWKQVAEEWIV